ncbi:lysozyme inhibitor LprI family protein [Massilia haematophila]|uniref:Lysozyme inhibitor LprI family protein n=1 Tax=Massilia haematophila TaxID=457923 RepID=A0ABV7PQU3_9BURK
MPHAIRPLLLALLLAAEAAAAAPYPNVYGAPPEVLRSTDWYRQCLRVRDAQLPRQHQPAPAESERCDASALYYDTLHLPQASDADWRRVRECAVRTHASGVLMMLYANGAGMTPNFDLATKYACSIQSPVNEMKSRVQHLRRRASGEDRAQVDVCDDVVSAEMRGQCGAIRERQRDKSRSGELAALTRDWSAKEQLGLEMASKAAHYFAQHRVDYETDTGSPAARSLQIDSQAAELDSFVADVLDFEAGRVPRHSEAEFASLEHKMDAVYRRFMATRPASHSYLGAIRKTGVEKTQRAWLAYRDAMELFGSIRYPQVPGSGWRALLTARRIKQLTELDNAAAGR